MKKFSASLYKIGEVASVCSVTRRMLLNYEELGVLRPSVVNEESGYRYYSPQDVSNLQLILNLKEAGMPLSDIADYLHGRDVTERQLKRLKELRDTIDRGISELESRQVAAGDYFVERVSMPKRVCFSRDFTCHSVEEATEAVYETFDEAIYLGLKLSREWTNFCEFPSDEYLKGNFDLGEFKMRACIPLVTESAPDECIIYPVQNALVVHHRGRYEGISAAYFALRDYIVANDITPAGHVQEMYIEGACSRGIEKERYITKVFLPIREKE